MKAYRRGLTVACVAVAAIAGLQNSSGSAEEKLVERLSTRSDQPFLAIWREDHGFTGEPPCLRFAIWDDGRVVFARDPDKWGPELLEGRIASYRVDRLNKALAETDVSTSRETAMYLSTPRLTVRGSTWGDGSRCSTFRRVSHSASPPAIWHSSETGR